MCVFFLALFSNDSIGQHVAAYEPERAHTLLSTFFLFRFYRAISVKNLLAGQERKDASYHAAPIDFRATLDKLHFIVFVNCLLNRWQGVPAISNWHKSFRDNLNLNFRNPNPVKCRTPLQLKGWQSTPRRRPIPAIAVCLKALSRFRARYDI